MGHCMLSKAQWQSLIQTIQREFKRFVPSPKFQCRHPSLDWTLNLGSGRRCNIQAIPIYYSSASIRNAMILAKLRLDYKQAWPSSWLDIMLSAAAQAKLRALLGMVVVSSHLVFHLVQKLKPVKGTVHWIHWGLNMHFSLYVPLISLVLHACFHAGLSSLVISGGIISSGFWTI